MKLSLSNLTGYITPMRNIFHQPSSLDSALEWLDKNASIVVICRAAP
jgi:hypothetical protein